MLGLLLNIPAFLNLNVINNLLKLCYYTKRYHGKQKVPVVTSVLLTLALENCNFWTLLEKTIYIIYQLDI